MSLAIIISIIVLGLLLLTLEIVALPGGIAGILGFLLIAVGVWQGYATQGSTGGTIILCCTLAACIVLLALFLKPRTWNRFSLKEESDSAVNQIDDPNITIGARGNTIARLAPTGKALIDGQLVEVHAVNKFIDPDRPIEVVAIEGYRIDVRETEDTRFDNEPANNNQ